MVLEQMNVIVFVIFVWEYGNKWKKFDLYLGGDKSDFRFAYYLWKAEMDTIKQNRNIFSLL